VVLESTALGTPATARREAANSAAATEAAGCPAPTETQTAAAGCPSAAEA